MPALRRKVLAEWIAQVAKQHQHTVGELSYLFTDNERMLAANEQFLQHSFYTDIITFPYNHDDQNEFGEISGDILISTELVKSNAKDFNQPYASELHRVIIHGVLHLCGIKDESEQEAVQMRAEEDKALALLRTLMGPRSWLR